MNTQKIMRLADIYAERCNDHQRHATKETHHDMMLFRKALEAEATRLHSVNAELLEALKWMVANDDTNEGEDPVERLGGQSWNEYNSYWIDGLNKARSAIAKAQE
jgi:hypothetical protein